MNPLEPGYYEWRKKKAWRNIIIIILLMILFVSSFIILYVFIDASKKKTKIKIEEFGEVVKEYREKNVPLKTDIITKCINGKKAIIVNGTFYYAGDIDTWGDIKGVDCE